MRQPTRRPPKTPWRERIGSGEVALAVTSYLVLTFVIGNLLISLFLESTGYPRQSVTAVLVSVGVSAIGAILSAGLVLSLRRTTSTAASIGLRRTSTRWLLVGAGGGLLCLLTTGAITAIYFSIAGSFPNPQANLLGAEATILQSGLLVLLVGLIVPIGEELLMRGVLYTWLRRWGLLLAVVLSSLPFALLHGLNIIFVAAVIGGVVFALLYEWSGSLWPSIVAHALYNTTLFGLGALLVWVS